MLYCNKNCKCSYVFPRCCRKCLVPGTFLFITFHLRKDSVLWLLFFLLFNSYRSKGWKKTTVLGDTRAFYRRMQWSNGNYSFALRHKITNFASTLGHYFLLFMFTIFFFFLNFVNILMNVSTFEQKYFMLFMFTIFLIFFFCSQRDFCFFRREI